MGFMTKPTILKRISGEASWVATGQFGAILLSILTLALLTRKLDQNDFAILTLSIAASSLANQTAFGGIANASARFYPIALLENSAEQLIASVKQIETKISIILISVALAFIALFAIIYSSYASHIAVAALALVMSISVGLVNINGAILNAANRRRTQATLNLSEGTIRLGLVWLLTHTEYQNATSVFAVYVVSSCLIYIAGRSSVNSLLKSVHSTATNAYKKEWRADIWRYAKPFALWGPFSWAQSSSDRWALETSNNRTELANYAVAYQIGYAPIGMLLNLVITTLSPHIFGRVGDSRCLEKRDSAKKALSQLVAGGCLLVTLGTVLGFLLHRQIYEVLVGEQYWNSSIYLPYMILAGGVYSVGQLLSLQFQITMNPAAILTCKIGSSILGIVISFSGAFFFGIHGVLGGAVIFAFTYTLWMFVLTRDAVSKP
jgi:O-antigen/teichoic acid export membrane protein